MTTDLPTGRRINGFCPGRIGLCLAVICLAWSGGCDSAPQASSSSATSSGTARLEIDFADRADNKSMDVPCSKNSTVFQLLERAQNMGDLEFQASGSGETAFVISIDGVKNEGAGGDNWVYRVNDQLGDQSSDAFPAKPGDHVLWVFGKYQPAADQ